MGFYLVLRRTERAHYSLTLHCTRGNRISKLIVRQICLVLYQVRNAYCRPSDLSINSLWAGVEYAHSFPACCMRQLKGCRDGSASTAWDYAGLLCNLYLDDGPKHFHHSQTSRAISPLDPFYTGCNLLLTVTPFLRSQH